MNHINGKIASHELVQSFLESKVKKETRSSLHCLCCPVRQPLALPMWLVQTEMSCEYKMHTVVPRLSTKENTDCLNHLIFMTILNDNILDVGLKCLIKIDVTGFSLLCYNCSYQKMLNYTRGSHLWFVSQIHWAVLVYEIRDFTNDGWIKCGTSTPGNMARQ